MEARDIAYNRFKDFLKTINASYWDNVRTEADTRMKIIDPIFTEVLGWPKSNIFLESQAGDGFIDYRFQHGSLNKMVVEAKKESRNLGLRTTDNGKYLKLNGSVLHSDGTVKDGIKQAINYCAYTSVDLSCVTNGREWVIFRGNRAADGKSVLDGKACCFGDLERVLDKFSLFYELLSYESVINYTYRAHFSEAEGQPSRSAAFRAPVKSYDEAVYVMPDKIHKDLDRIMCAFFQDLSGLDDPEARTACFVTTKESQVLEENLLRISEDLRSKARELRTEEGKELTEAIRRVQERKRKEMILLVGTKGAGKSTFIDRFFNYVLPVQLRNDCAVVKIDLSKSGCDSSQIIKWLDENFLEEAENILFRGAAPEWDDYVGMYYKAYQRLSEGTLKHLYKTNKDEFKIRFGDYIEEGRRDRKREYIINLLHRTFLGHNRVPCLIFDNADHFDVSFQEEVFKFAHSLYQQCVCLVILPITDTTSWQLSKEGAMQSFFTESFFLPTPPTEMILRKRIEYIEKKIQNEKPEKGKGYALENGFGLEIDNIKQFTACLQTILLNNSKVASWIGSLSNISIRKSLMLTREIMNSPHIKVRDLLNSYVAKNAMVANEEDIKFALIKGKYDNFSRRTLFIQNLYDIDSGNLTSPLLGVRILLFLKEQYESNKDNDSRYVQCTKVCEYFHNMNIEPSVTTRWLSQMLKMGLVLSYDPTVTDIADNTKVEISPSGKHHLSWGINEWVYIECMSIVTPLLCSITHAKIESAVQAYDAYSCRMAIKSFIEYLIKEDAYYCIIPEHPSYESQKEIIIHLSRTGKNIVSMQTGVPVTSRYYRLRGTIKNLPSGKEFGFIRQDDSGEDLFFHKSQLIDVEFSQIKVGDIVEYDMGSTNTGSCALKIIVDSVS